MVILSMMHILGDPVTLITAAIAGALSIGLSFLAMALAPKPKSRFTFDDTPTTLSTRGSYAPLINGEQRMGYVFAWAGDRKTKKVKQGGGGGSGFGGGGKSSQYIYYESAWHILAVGPCSQLYKIRQNEKVIWEGPIFRLPKGSNPATPSGTTFDCPDGEGSFTIYWGECNQPVNDFLGDKLPSHARSRWPHICYIQWNPKKLGSSPTWGQLDYEMGCNTGNFNDSFPGVSTYIDITEEGASNRGVSPHTWLWQLLTGAFPHGCGIDSEHFHGDSFADLGQLAIDEHLPINQALRDGQQLSEGIGYLMREVGFFLTQEGDLVRVRPIRAEAGTLPEITPDVDLDPDPEIERQHGYYAPTRVSYSFFDRDANYRSSSINIDDDGPSRVQDRPQAQQVELYCVTDKTTAYTVMKRRFPEFSSNGFSLRLKTTRETRYFWPGMAVLYQPVGQIRIISVQLSEETSAVEIEAMLDIYSLGVSDYTPGSGGGGGGATLDPAPDTVVKPLLVPPELSPDPSKAYYVFARVRANDQVSSAAVFLRKNTSTSYTEVGQQDSASGGGVLNAAMDATPGDLTTGPVITVYNDDIADAAIDLTDDDEGWTGGAQLLVVEDEIMLLRSVTAVVGGWQMNGVRRGAFGTTVATHAVSSIAIIVVSDDMTPIHAGMMTPGQLLYVKTQPANDRRVVNLGSVTPVGFTVPDPLPTAIVGGGTSP